MNYNVYTLCFVSHHDINVPSRHITDAVTQMNDEEFLLARLGLIIILLEFC